VRLPPKTFFMFEAALDAESAQLLQTIKGLS
jgi:hypothetical protein